MRRVFLSAALALVGIAGVAQAHPKLLSASPAANAAVAKPARITLQFSEKLMPKFSGADLMMTGHAGKTHVPMKIPAVAAVGAEGHTLVVTPKAPLAAGSYTVAWHVVSADTHRVSGNIAFSVK